MIKTSFDKKKKIDELSQSDITDEEDEMDNLSLITAFCGTIAEVYVGFAHEIECPSNNIKEAWSVFSDIISMNIDSILETNSPENINEELKKILLQKETKNEQLRKEG